MSRAAIRRGFLIPLMLLAASACTVRPISLKAVPGETIIFPIVYDDPLFTVGFSSTELAYTDWQFGTLVFDLVHDSDSGCNRTLYPRWVTRAWPDPASPAGIVNELPGVPLTRPLTSQVLVALDIPVDACPGTYTWEISNDAPANPPPAGLEGALFRDAAEGMPAGLNQAGHHFEVLDLPAPSPNNRSNPLEGYLGSQTGDLDLALLWLIPFHKVGWDFVGNVMPAAADIVFEYPLLKLVPRNVFEDNHLGRGSIVRWCIAGGSGCPPDPNPSDEIGVLHVRFADPDQRVERLSIAFELTDQPAQGPLWTADFGSTPGKFRVVSARFYDGWGNDITDDVELGFAGVW